MIVIDIPIHGDILYNSLKYNVDKKYFEQHKNNIIHNVFLNTPYKQKFKEFIDHNNKIISIINRFYYKLKQNLTNNKTCENNTDLCENEYNSIDKKIYLYNYNEKKKWWFSISTINYTICNRLCY